MLSVKKKIDHCRLRANYLSMYGTATMQSFAKPQGAASLRVDPSLLISTLSIGEDFKSRATGL
jgi:hypothetical protein